MKRLTKKQLQVTRVHLKERDGSNCHYCGMHLIVVRKANLKRLTNKHAQVEHIHAFEDGGSNELDNLVLSCRRCNVDKGKTNYDTYVQKKYEVVKLHYETLEKIK